MRASRRRLDHSTVAGSSSVSTARSLKRPWMAKPSASRTARPMVTRPGGRPVRRDQVVVRQRGRHLEVAAQHLGGRPARRWCRRRRRRRSGRARPASPRRCASAASRRRRRATPPGPRRSRASRRLGPLRRARGSAAACSGGRGARRAWWAPARSRPGPGRWPPAVTRPISWIVDRAGPGGARRRWCAGRWPRRRRGTRRAGR